MDRNLFRRIEVAFPVEAPELRARVVDDLEMYLQDDTQAWLLDSAGGYTRADGAAGLCAQTRLLSQFDERIAFLEP
jgi:polyphosphate kinase